MSGLNNQCLCCSDCKCGVNCMCGPYYKCGPTCQSHLRSNNGHLNSRTEHFKPSCTKCQTGTTIESFQPTSKLIPDIVSKRGQSCSELSTADLDRLCKRSEVGFKRFDPKATILPGIGLPSQNNGVCTILHTMGPGATNLKINGLESKSPLANAALFSSECSNGKFINLYEMMLPEGLSKIPGEESNAEKYAKELNQQGINVAGTHWHWWASDPYVAAIHHQKVGMNPVEFVGKTTNALSNYRNRMNM